MVNTEKYLRYHHRIIKDAAFLLKNILPSISSQRNSMHILVVGAGSFPSYGALTQLLALNKNLRFTLVEPEKKMTDFFLQHVVKPSSIVCIFNGDIKSFLKLSSAAFDIIYFEHPETMTLPIILSYLGATALKRVRTLREAMPSLMCVMRPSSYIIASCMTRHELHQLKHLLQFSFQTKPILWQKKSLKRFFYGGPYTAGLTCKLSKDVLPISANVQAIKNSHWQLLLAILIGLCLYIFLCYRLPGSEYSFMRLFSIILIIAQLYLHRPGKLGTLIKFILLNIQSFLVAFL